MCSKDRYLYLSISAFLCFLAVALGAFGAHGLRKVLSDYYLDVFKTGNYYHFIHSLAILVLLGQKVSHSLPSIKRIIQLFLAGIVIFSGSLYILATTGISIFGMITPIGGFCFLIAWFWLGLAFYKQFKKA